METVESYKQAFGKSFVDQKLLVPEQFQELIWFLFPSEVLPELQHLRKGLDFGTLETLARQSAALYGNHHRTYLIADAEALRAPFDACGFQLVHFAPPPDDAPVRDVPGAPGNAQAARWRILARRTE